MDTLTGITKRLVEQGHLQIEDALNAVEDANKDDISIVQYLIEKDLVDSNIIAVNASEEFGLPYFDLGAYDLECAPNIVKTKLIEAHKLLPLFKRGDRIFIGIFDPSNLQALDEIKFQTNLSPEPIVVEYYKLLDHIKSVVSKFEISSLIGVDEGNLDSIEIGHDLEEDLTEVTEDDTPIVRFINKVLIEAISEHVSDIHFEPYEKMYRIRFRQDGVLREYGQPPANLGQRIAARVKVMSKLDISEKRIPQDGRFKMRISQNNAIDFRVSTCPTLFGEKVVMRILDPSSATLGIDALGYESFQQEIFTRIIHNPQGMVLVTGPTGSGKTVSLYTALNILNVAERNISTAEDPAEINLPGINQVNVNPKAGLTFASALRSFLRQDPDIIMVGEIRDLETAEIAIKAAQTGHMVLSTLHTNNAPETLTRLINMGVASFNVATSVSLIIAQRLARKLCQHCKIEAKLPEKALLEAGFQESELGEVTLFEAAGCKKCKAGYKGRVGIYEVMPISKEISEIIMREGTSLDIANQAQKENIWDLRQSGLNKAKQGVTSLAEINRVTKD